MNMYEEKRNQRSLFKITISAHHHPTTPVCKGEII